MKHSQIVLFGILFALLIVISLSPMTPRTARATDQVYGNNGTSDGNYYSMSASRLVGTIYTTPADMGALVDAHFYAQMAAGGTSVNVKFVIVLASTATIIANGVSNPVSVTTTLQWYTVTWTTAPTLSASTDYCLMIIRDSGLYNVYLYRSSLGSSVARLDTSNSYATPTDPTDWANQNPYYLLYCHYTPPNTAPVNVVASCTNLEPYSYICARYKPYTFNCTVTDADQATDLATVTMEALLDGVSEWSVRYTEATNGFAEYSDPNDYITLNTGSCTYSKSGTTLKAYFSITTNWNHPDLLPNQLRLTSIDDGSASDQDTYTTNYNFESRLEFSTGPTLSDGSGTATRGNTNGAITASGVLCYVSLMTALHPPTSEADVWVVCSDVATSPWEAANYEATSGTFSVTVYADDAVGLDTYTFKAVAQGGGSSGTDQCHEPHTATYIADRVTVTLSLTYSKLGVGQNCSGLLVSGVYDYGGSFDGTIALNSSTFSYATAGYRGYTTISVSGGAHSVTAFTSNSLTVLWQNATCTWSHFWTRYSEFLWFAHIDVVSLTWSVEGSTLPTGATVLFYENGSLFTTDTVSSGAIDAVHDYGAGWAKVVWTLKLTYVSAPYNVTTLLIYTHTPETVPVVHTIYPEFYLAWTDLYLYVTWFTNWHNASMWVWSNVTTLWGYSYYEGVTQLVLPTTIGLYMVDLLVNGSSPWAGTNTGAYPANDAWHWYHLNFTISVSAYTTLCMVFKQADGLTVIPWLTFHVFVDTYECSQSQVVVAASSTVNVTVTDDYGAILWQNLAYPTGATTNTFLRQTLTVYYAIFNNGRDYPQDALIVRSGVLHWLPAIGGHASFPYLIYPGSYTAYWFKNGVVGGGGYASPDYGLATEAPYAFTVTTTSVAINTGVDYPPTNQNPGGGLPPFFTVGVLVGFTLLTLLGLITLLRRGGVAKQEPESVTVGPSTRRVRSSAEPQSHAASVQAYLNGEQARRAQGVAQLNERLQRRTQPNQD